MGIRQISLVILVFILLSSTVYAVDFEWALADTSTKNLYGLWNPAEQNQRDESFHYDYGATVGEPRLLVAQLWYYGHDIVCNRCRIGLRSGITYNGLVKDYCQAIGTDRYSWLHFFNIADGIRFGGCQGWRNYCCGSCSTRCEVDYEFQSEYYQVAVSGINSVFVKDQTKSLGNVNDLMGDFPENGSIVLGLNSYFKNSFPQDNYVLSWFGSCGDPDQDYPNDVTKKYTNDETSCFLVCTDLNLNSQCDHKEAIVQRCFDGGGDWYAFGGYAACCAAITTDRPGIPDILTRDCATYELGLNAICGQDDGGQYRWAPLDRPGMATNLLGCPGYTTLAENYPNSSICIPEGTIPAAFNITIQNMPHSIWWSWMLDRFEGRTGWEQVWGLGVEGDAWFVGRFTNPGALLKFLRDERATSTPWAAVLTCRMLADTGNLPGIVHADITEGGTAYFYGGSEDWPNLYCPVRGPVMKEMAPAVSVKGALGTHDFICDTGSGYVFECAGEVASYTDTVSNPVNVAAMGAAISDIVETGGCPSKIVAYWNFDNGTAEDVIAGKNGTFPSNQANRPVSVAAGSGKGFEFDGVDVIYLPSNFTLPDPGNKLSIGAWIKLSDIPSDGIIIEKEGAFGLKVVGTPGTSQGKLKGAVNTNGGLSYFGDGPLEVGTWHHVALTYDGEEVEVFVDGESFGYQPEAGMVKNNNLPFVIGKNFKGVIDEVAVYSKDLSYFLIESQSSHMQPTSYCGVGTTDFPENLYCASDGDWTPDLDIKDKISCNAADFGWTGHYCCSEDDDADEYYSDYDSPPAPFDYVRLVGKATPTDAPTKFELDNNFDRVTIFGPVKFKYNVYSQKRIIGGGFRKCPGGLIENRTVELKPGQTKTFKIKEPAEGIPTDDCKYRSITIESVGTKSGGGCWDKKVIPAGDLVDSHVLNYKGTFYGCGIPQNSLFLSLTNDMTGSTLFDASTIKSPDCSMLSYARFGDEKPHAVCTPSGVWKFVADPDATQNSSVGWNIAAYNVTGATQIGCCRPDQCWNGLECIDMGKYYSVDSDSYFCKE